MSDQTREDSIVASADNAVDDDQCRKQTLERHTGRKRGMITPKDREFVCQPPDAEDTNRQLLRDRRYRIRERIKNGLKDFELFAKFLPDCDRTQIFKSLQNKDTNFLKEVAIFLYLGFLDVNEDKKEFLEDVIEEAERREGREVNVEVTKMTTTAGSVYQHGPPESDPSRTLQIEWTHKDASTSAD